MGAIEAAPAELDHIEQLERHQQALGSRAGGGKGRAQAPTVPYDEIHVTIDLRQPHEAHAA